MGCGLVAVGAGCQLVLSGCWWFCAGGYGCSLPAVAIDALRLWAGGYVCSRPAVAIDALRLCAGGCGCSMGTDAGQLVLLTR